MGQCVSRKAGAVIAASEHHGSPSYRIMEKPPKNQNESKGATKRAPYTRGTATSFGFRRRPSSGIPMPVGASYGNDGTGTTMHQRSKSAGPEQERRRDEDSCHQRFHSSSSGRSTPRLAPPKKEAASTVNGLRTNRFGFRQPQPRYTNKVGDISSSHSASHYNQEKVSHQQHQLLQNHHQQQQQQPQQIFQQQRDIHQESYGIGRQLGRPGHERQSYVTAPSSKLRPSPVNNPPTYAHQTAPNAETERRTSGIPEPISKYTLHTSHLPLPQFAVRMNEANPKVAKTVANQSRKVSTTSKGSNSSKEGSGTEDSGLGSQQGYPVEHDIARDAGVDYRDSGTTALRRNHGRPRNLRMVLSGKSFDVRDVEDDSTVTEISVIPLPKSFATGANLNTGFVRDRAVQYQRVLNKDNRYTDSTTSMSTTSSEGYDEGLGEEKVYKDRSHNEKLASIKSDFSPPSSDDPEYGHGEAMADEYSLSSSDECRGNNNSRQHLKTISNAAKSGALPKSTLRSVLLTIEDPAFAAAAATTTSLIDDETSPVDSLVDSLTASITQSDGKNSRKECVMERSGCTLEDDSPGTPTNASNSLSLSEGREFFDDEIADQPGLTFDDTLRNGADTQSVVTASHPVTENSHTLVESAPKSSLLQGRSVENSPIHGRRISRAGSVGTLSPCESITSDDLMLDYECSEDRSYDESNRRLDSNTALHELDDATIKDVMREWSTIMGTAQNHSNSNLANNNVSTGNNNNNHTNSESGIANARTSRLLRNRSGTDSPRSLDSVRTRQVSNPFRPVFTGNVQSPSLDSGDEGSLRVERFTYHQDIVSIKTDLLKLMRVVQEAETLNPFSTTMVNGLFNNLNEDGTTDTSTNPINGSVNVADELTDLRRQVVFLQGQLEDKDRTIQQLQMQISKHQDLSQSSASSMNGSSSFNKDTCNATTQTEKMRPVSAGPSLLQSLPQDSGMGPLVSWSDSWNRQRPPSLADINMTRNLRKPSDRSPRTSRPRPDETGSIRHNGFTDKSLAESLTVKRLVKPRETIPSRSLDLNDFVKTSVSKAEITPTKTSIPSPKKLTTPTQIPRAARAVSATGRSHNL
ncbi:uncharacterized protein [Venturia canescens]|uniref:uncharacterized protein isoform X2 n=1 Tax=Venturia canescens TaxID=32260 RepID=UPI001C9BD149|nr:uncharacterized protein LOC122409872 isoform X2 [Venturia canescens]